jgi:hypothetical protein
MCMHGDFSDDYGRIAIVRYGEVLKFVWTTAICGRMAKVYVLYTVLQWFESVPCPLLQRSILIGSVSPALYINRLWMLVELANEERRQKTRGEGSEKGFYFVSIWQASRIVMTDQSRRIRCRLSYRLWSPPAAKLEGAWQHSSTLDPTEQFCAYLIRNCFLISVHLGCKDSLTGIIQNTERKFTKW